MATTFKLKRKLFAEIDPTTGKPKMSTGKKLVIGTGATLGTAALAFAGARRGVFGANTMLKANNAYMSAGKRLMQSKSSTISGLGTGMMKSGAARGSEAIASKVNAVRASQNKAAMEGEELKKFITNTTNTRVNRATNAVAKATAAKA